MPEKNNTPDADASGSAGSPGQPASPPAPLERGAWEGDSFFDIIRYDFPQCEWRGAINFDPRRTGEFGYLLSCQLPGGIDLKKDMTLICPYVSGGDFAQTLGSPYISPDSAAQHRHKLITCVGVIEAFGFKGACNDPIYIKAYISKANAAAVTGVIGTKLGILPPGPIQLLWYIIACDGAGSGWYEAAYVQNHTPAVKVNIDTETEGRHEGKPRISIASRSTSLDDDAVDIRVYEFKFQMRPDPTTTAAQLGFATASGARMVLPWGGTPQKPA